MPMPSKGEEEYPPPTKWEAWLRWLSWKTTRLWPWKAPRGFERRDGQPFWPDDIVEATLECEWPRAHGSMAVRARVTACFPETERLGSHQGWKVSLVPHEPTEWEWQRVWWYFLKDNKVPVTTNTVFVRHYDIVSRLAELDE